MLVNVRPASQAVDQRDQINSVSTVYQSLVRWGNLRNIGVKV